MNTILAILLIIYAFVTFIGGTLYGNRKLFSAEGTSFSQAYVIWFVVKNTLIAGFVYIILIAIAGIFLKGNFWSYMSLIA
jgi:hypothetical protein